MTARRVFVTGTDTGVGKTHVTCALLAGLRARGLTVAAMKPVASGCTPTAEGLRNDDAVRLRLACDPIPDYGDVNPFALAPPIAPHLAAARAGLRIDPGPVIAAAQRLAAGRDALLIEGIGGWRVPLAPRLELPDLVAAVGAGVVLVVGLRLGCINHALLSAESIVGRAALIGWVANTIDPGYREVDETVASLEDRLPAPLLGVLPYADPPPGHLVGPLAGALAAALDRLHGPPRAG